jgi:hypothetical protein
VSIVGLRPADTHVSDARQHRPESTRPWWSRTMGSPVSADDRPRSARYARRSGHRHASGRPSPPRGRRTRAPPWRVVRGPNGDRRSDAPRPEPAEASCHRRDGRASRRGDESFRGIGIVSADLCGRLLGRQCDRAPSPRSQSQSNRPGFGHWTPKARVPGRRSSASRTGSFALRAGHGGDRDRVTPSVPEGAA